MKTGNQNPNYKYGHYCRDKVHFCIEKDCTKIVCGFNRRCSPHAQLKRYKNPQEKEKLSLSMSGKNNPFYGKKHTVYSKQKIKKNHANISGVNNPRFGIKLSKETRTKVSLNHADFSGNKNPMRKNRIINHHIYLRRHEDTIKLETNKHRALHARAYDYVFERYGKKGINAYLKWFDKKYGLK
jgi:hypothetical protein